MLKFLKKIGWTFVVLLILDVFYRVLMPLLATLSNSIYSSTVISTAVSLIGAIIAVCIIAAVYKMRNDTKRRQYYETIDHKYYGLLRDAGIILKDRDWLLETAAFACIAAGFTVITLISTYKLVSLPEYDGIVPSVLTVVGAVIALTAVYALSDMIMTAIIHKKWVNKANIERCKNNAE